MMTQRVVLRSVAPAAAASQARTKGLTAMSVAVLAVSSLLLSACGRDGAAQAAAGGGMPSIAVGVLTVQPGAVALTGETPGRLEAWRTAQVRARVAGIVQKRLYTEGMDVKAGQPLYQLDDAGFRAALASAEAQRARVEAALVAAQAQYTRNQPLAEQRAISQQEWVATQAALKQAEADLAATKAAVQSARINVDYAAITAPIAGRIGRSTVTEGALVGPTDTTALATLQQLDRLYVNFSQPASEVLRLERAFAAGQLERARTGSGGAGAEVRVVLDDGSEYALPGKLLFSEKTVDPGSGQVSLRAELPNPKGLLLPGLFVKVRWVQARSSQAVLLPQQAVTRGPGGDIVQVLGADGKVAPRKVQISGSQGAGWVVESGLKAGEQVVVDGVQRLAMMPGAPIKAVPWVPAGAAQASGAAAASAGGAASAPAAPASR